MRPLPRHATRSPAWPLAVAALLLLGGCASLDTGEAYGRLNQTTQPITGQSLTVVRQADELRPVADEVARLLQQPLSAPTAVRIALINNRSLQARLQQIGITQAELVQASRLPNPGFSFGRMTRGSEVEIERGLHVNLARALVLPWVATLEQRRLEAIEREVAMDVLQLAAETRRAWVTAVAAEESLRYSRQVLQAAEAGAELARRMEQVGNFNKLMRAREQGFQADAALSLARAEQQQQATRERLTRLLGLWGEQTRFALPERLPDLPAAARERPDIEREAMAQRLDVQAARLAAEQTARNLGLTRSTRFINVFELGIARNTSTEAPVQRGWEISLELPLFDGGGARVAKAEAIYMQSVHQAAAFAINARSEVREAYGQYRLAHDIARHHRDEIVPLRKRISDEQLLRYNGMLIGVFELLADARLQIASVNAAIDALRDFWLAEADLDQALTGRISLAMPRAVAPAGAATGSDPH